MDKSNKLEDKLDKMDQRLDTISETLIINTAHLREHMRRTELLEQYVQDEVTPIKKHVEMVKYGIQGVLWISGALAALAVFALTLSQLGFLKF